MIPYDRNRICNQLAPLASLAAQRRYIVHAEHDAYYVPDQMLEDAMDVARVVASAEDAADLPAGFHAEVHCLARLALAADLGRSSNHELIESNASWRAVREQAQKCLSVLGFDLTGWENAEGLVMRK